MLCPGGEFEPAGRSERRTVMVRSKKKLGEILVGWGVITAEQADKAVTLAKGSGKKMGEALVEGGFALFVAVIVAVKMPARGLGERR